MPDLLTEQQNGGFTAADLPLVHFAAMKAASGGNPAVFDAISYEVVASGISAGATPITEETGTTYLATADDFPTTKEFNNASAIALTIPVDLDVAMNTVFEIHQTGAGAVTIAGASGVTVQSEGGKLTTRGQYAIAGIKCVAANVYRVTGNVTA